MLKRKKKIELIGTLLLPLVIGNAAFIQCGNDTRWTSVVRHFIEQPSGVIHELNVLIQDLMVLQTPK